VSPRPEAGETRFSVGGARTQHDGGESDSGALHREIPRDDDVHRPVQAFPPIGHHVRAGWCTYVFSLWKKLERVRGAVGGVAIHLHKPCIQRRAHFATVSVVCGVCWWKSGSKGGLRHNSPLSLSHPLLTAAKGTTATSAKKEDVETKQHKENTSEYLADRRTKEL
jgi:hypothetical protein